LSFLGSIGSIFSRVGTAIVTGGTSELARLVAPGLVQSLEGKLFPTSVSDVVSTAALVAGVSPASIAGVKAGNLFNAAGNYFYTPPPAPAPTPSTLLPSFPLYNEQGIPYAPVDPMAFTPGAVIPGGNMSLNLNQLLGSVSSIFGGSQNPTFQNIADVAGIAQNFTPAPTYATPVASRSPGAALPSVGGMAARALAGVGAKFAQKFPNLAAGINAWRIQGKNVTRKRLYAMMKRFGPDFLITAGILSAAAVAELMMAGPGTRRMNPGNVKALRRSMRRLESFHHLCTRADKLRRPRSRHKTVIRGGRTQEFIRQG
jgi:hypothetical protein